MILFRHCCGGIHSREQLHGQGYKTDPIFMNACVSVYRVTQSSEWGIWRFIHNIET